MKEKIYSIGIDVSKQTLEVCFLGAQFKTLKEFKIENNSTDIQQLLKKIKSYSLEKDAGVVLESTSSYHVLVTLLVRYHSVVYSFGLIYN